MREEEDVEAVDKGGIGMGVDESGWKQVHGEVFRRPPHLALFSALIGTGYQLVVMVLVGILCAITGSVYSSRLNLTVVFVLVYGFTSFVAGYTSGAYYRSHFYPDPAPNWCVPLGALSTCCAGRGCWCPGPETARRPCPDPLL
jgi:hypothetical protein